MPTASELIIRVRTDGTGQARVELMNLDRQIDQTGQTAGKSAGKFGSLKQGIDQLSPVALGATGAIVGLGLGAKAAVDASISWESALAGVAKTLDSTGLSAEEFDAAVQDIGAALREMATEIPVSAVELAGIAEAAGQLGIARGDVVEFTRTMAELGVATNLTSTQAAESFARFTNITGGAIDDIDNLASALVDLGNNSATTESEILDMAMRIAAAGTQAGFSQEEILGMAAAMSSMGLEAEAGGTAMSRVILEMESAVIDGGDALAQFASVAGMSAESFAAAWRANPQDALNSFLSGLRDVEQSGGNTTAILDELQLGGIRVGDSVRRASGNVELFAGSMERANTASAEGNALQEETARRFETTASQIQIAKNEITDAAIRIGDELAPAVVEIAILAAEATGKLADFITMIRETGEAAVELSGGGPSGGGGLDDYLTGLGAGFRVASGGSEDLRGDLDKLWTGLLLGRNVTEEVTEEVSIFERAIRGVQDAIANLPPLHGPTFNEYLVVVQEAATKTDELSDTVETWMALQAESEQRWRGVAVAAGDQTMAIQENDIALTGLIDTTNEHARATVEAAQAAIGLHDTQTDLATINDIMNQRIAESESAISHWEGRVSDVDTALGYLDEQLAAGNITTEEHRQATEKLTEYQARLAQGIEDDLIPGFIDSQLASAELQEQMDNLNQAYADGKISEQEYAEAAAGIREEMEKNQNPIQTLIEKVVTLIEKLIELEEQDPEVEITANTDAILNAIESMRAYAASHPINVPMYGTVAGGNDAVMYVPGGSAGGDDRELQGARSSFFTLGTDAGAVYADGFVTGVAENIGVLMPDMMNDILSGIARDFSGPGIVDIMTGAEAARLQEDAKALEAYMMALVEMGFGPESAAYQEVLADYQELMDTIAALTGIAGTEAAQEFWEQWERENGERRWHEDWANETAENIWRHPGWEEAGKFAGSYFWDGALKLDWLELGGDIGDAIALGAGDALVEYDWSTPGSVAAGDFTEAFQKVLDNELLMPGETAPDGGPVDPPLTLGPGNDPGGIGVLHGDVLVDHTIYGDGPFSNSLLNRLSQEQNAGIPRASREPGNSGIPQNIIINIDSQTVARRMLNAGVPGMTLGVEV